MNICQRLRPLQNPYCRQIEIIKDIWNSELFGIERCFLLFLALFLMAMPGMVVRWLGGKAGYFWRKIAVDFWVLLKPTAWIAVLYIGLSKSIGVQYLVYCGLVDLYAYLLGLVFLRRFFHPAASHSRNVLLLGINLMEAILGYAILYIHYGAIGTGLPKSGAIECAKEALYFSVATTTTVGFGDIKPLSSAGQTIAMFQMLSSLVFISVIATSFISNLPQKSGHDRNVSQARKRKTLP